MPNPLRHHRHYGEGAHTSFMERLAEAVASGLGTVAFVAISTLVIAVWIGVNAAGAVKFDAYPFILLNLMFSAQAFYTGALVIIAQKAQSRTDKLNEAAAAEHREELDARQQQILDAIHDKVREDTPGGVALVLNKLDELIDKSHVESTPPGDA